MTNPIASRLSCQALFYDYLRIIFIIFLLFVSCYGRIGFMEDTMAQWVRKLRIKEEWEQAKDGSLSVKRLADIIVRKLNRFNLSDDLELQGIIDDMEMLNDDAATEDFDYIMQNLYDWADTPLDNEWNGKKNCWIEIF
jgi:hypothetical protein